MKRITILISLLFVTSGELKAQVVNMDSVFPVRGICLEAPFPGQIDSFVNFISTQLAPAGINTLILRVDYRYQYRSHPELTDTFPLGTADVKKMVAACRTGNIRVIPQVNLLGHQSWQSHLGKLLELYPQFDETPGIKIPASYRWPNADRLYCKSYCPLHPGVHKVVFDVVDEICDAFETDAFHAGMDEVFYIGHPDCPRCQGHDKSALFAGEVGKIRDHLAQKNRQLWIWGDRLLEGKISGLGMWEASYDNTYRAIDIIPKDVFICDWHYERPDKTAVIFANKGLKVATAPWRHPEVTAQQVADMAQFRKDATRQVKDNYAGLIQTVWTPTGTFMQEAYQSLADPAFKGSGQWSSFVSMYTKMDEVLRGPEQKDVKEKIKKKK